MLRRLAAHVYPPLPVPVGADPLATRRLRPSWTNTPGMASVLLCV